MSSKKTGILSNLDPKIYNESIKEFSDKEVRQLNFEVSRSIANKIKTMYGPKGLSKMIIPVTNETIITQKGISVVKTFKSRVPITLMLINLVETQEKKCGDGTKTVLLFTAFLLEKAREMLNQGISAPIINKGFSIALRKVLEKIDDNVIALNGHYDEKFVDIISSVMNNKLTSSSKDYYINLILDTIVNNKSILIDSEDFDYTNIIFRKIKGKSVNESEVIKGIIIYKDKPTSNVPNKILKPKILLVQSSLEFFLPSNDEPFQKDVIIADIEKYKEFTQFKPTYYKNLANFFKEKGIDVILCKKKISPFLIEYCASIGMVALGLVGKDQLKKLSKMLKIKPISSIKEFSEAEIGKADIAEYKAVTEDEMFIIKKEDSGILTFLLRGGTPHVLDELEEIINASLRVGIQTLKDKKLLPGGGALESELSLELKKYAGEFSDKYQYVISEYGKALENLPAYLIMNSANDPYDLIPNLKAEHSLKKKYMGFDSISNTITNVVSKGIFDGYTAKKTAIKIGTEMARQILRVDGLVMVYNRKLYEKIEEEGKNTKKLKHQEKVRKYFKKNEKDITFT